MSCHSDPFAVGMVRAIRKAFLYEQPQRIVVDRMMHGGNRQPHGDSEIVVELCDLIESIQKLRPEADAPSVARIALLLLNERPNFDGLHQTEILEREIQVLLGRLQVAHDQHSAVAEELENLAATSPCEFSPSHIWTLIRAIKVQSQIINFYLEPLAVSSNPTERSY